MISKEEAMRRELHCFIVDDVSAPRRDLRRPRSLVAVVSFPSLFTTSQTQNLKLEAWTMVGLWDALDAIADDTSMRARPSHACVLFLPRSVVDSLAH
jgi:hypothetical protein